MACSLNAIYVFLSVRLIQNESNPFSTFLFVKSEEDDDESERTSKVSTNSEDELMDGSSKEIEYDENGNPKLSNAQILNELKSKQSQSEEMEITVEFIKTEYHIEDDERISSIHATFKVFFCARSTHFS